MDEQKKTEQEAPKPQFDIKDFSEEAQYELKVLLGIESFLKRVKGIEGDEAFLFVAARKYLVERCQMVAKAETLKLVAKAAVPAVEAPKAPEAPPTPPLTVVK